MDQFLFIAAFFFDLAGLAFVIGAGLIMLRQTLMPTAKKKSKGKKADSSYHENRKTFVHRIVLGLDFFIVADLVKVAFAGTYEALIQILLIVVIRTILSYFLLKESDL
jgi:uncharacterized membrane protein